MATIYKSTSLSSLPTSKLLNGNSVTSFYEFKPLNGSTSQENYVHIIDDIKNSHLSDDELIQLQLDIQSIKASKHYINELPSQLHYLKDLNIGLKFLPTHLDDQNHTGNDTNPSNNRSRSTVKQCILTINDYNIDVYVNHHESSLYSAAEIEEDIELDIGPLHVEFNTHNGESRINGGKKLKNLLSEYNIIPYNTGKSIQNGKNKKLKLSSNEDHDVNGNANGNVSDSDSDGGIDKHGDNQYVIEKNIERFVVWVYKSVLDMRNKANISDTISDRLFDEEDGIDSDSEETLVTPTSKRKLPAAGAESNGKQNSNKVDNGIEVERKKQTARKGTGVNGNGYAILANQHWE